MVRLSVAVLAAASVMMTAKAFTPSSHYSTTSLRMAKDQETESSSSSSGKKYVERGVSVDQDGKSNVWAIEPRIELSNKSAEENTQSALIAGGGLVAAAVAAGLILTNLPDPNQF